MASDGSLEDDIGFDIECHSWMDEWPWKTLVLNKQTRKGSRI